MDTWHVTVRVKGNGKEKEAKLREKALTATDSTEKAAKEKTKARNEANTAQRILAKGSGACCFCFGKHHMANCFFEDKKKRMTRRGLQNTVGPRQV